MNKNILKAAAFGLTLALLTGCASDVSVTDNSGSYDLDAFANMDIKIASGDVEIIEGDKFYISYDLHEKEIVETMEVKDGTLIFKTGVDFKFKPDMGDFFLNITIPEDAKLDKLNISSVAGDIEIEGRSFNEGDFKSVSGDIELENINSKKAEAKTTSGEISIEGNLKALTAETVSGDISLEGKLETEAGLKTVSGEIEAICGASSVEAESIGGIEYKGKKQGKNLNITDSEPKIFAKSVSGKITID